MTDVFDYLIIGGGAAGIGAARRLHALGERPLLLEATDRIGGRAQTIQANGNALDLGCGWLHSAERNAWTAIAEQTGYAIDRREAVWGQQFRNLGFSKADQVAAAAAADRWEARLAQHPPASDRASDALEPDEAWNAYIAARASFISGVGPEEISAQDYVAYDEASTWENWRVTAGYGTLIAASLPPSASVRTNAAVERLEIMAQGVAAHTRIGTIRALRAILTVSTAVLAGDAIRMPAEFDAWRTAAAQLPLGRNEKVFLEITGGSVFEDETYVLGNPRSRMSGGYYIRPLGAPVIEGFLGGDAARILDHGPEAGFAFALEQLVAIFGSDATRYLRPVAASQWGQSAWIGGGYSCALPGHAAARERLARPFADRVFLAGEATSLADFSTAHGAHDSGVRAADEAFAAASRRSR